MSFIGRNPNVDWINLVPRSADPTSPNEGDVYRSDGTVRPEGIWEYRDATWQQIGSASDISNYIAAYNSNFEGSVGDWVTYADAAGTSPVDGTGGSANITLTRTTTSSEVLNGIASAKLSKSAANRQGEGVSLNVTLDNSLKGKPVEISFNYSATSNFVYGSVDGVTPSDIQVFLYDVTNAALIPVFPNTLDGTGIFKGQFQAASNSTSYRVILHIRSTSALAYDLFFDNVAVKRVEAAFIQADTDWISYTPTFTNFGTVSVSNFRYRKQGPNIEIAGTFTSGTPAAGEARISLPTGLSTPSGLPTLSQAGMLVEGAAVVNVYYITIEASTAYMTVTSQGDGGLAKLNANGFANSGNVYSVNAVIPIQGFTSGFTSISTVAQNIPTTLRAFKNGGAVTANTTIASWTTVSLDTVGSFNATTGEVTIKIPGTYRFSFKVETTSGTPIASIYKNGTEVDKGLNSGVRSTVNGILANLIVGDVITARIDSSLTIASNNISTTLELEKIDSPDALLTVNRSTTKTLSSNTGSAGGTSTLFTFNNLIVGKKYRIVFSGWSISANTQGAGFKITLSNAVSLDPLVDYLRSNAEATGKKYPVHGTYEFTATSSTLTIQSVHSASFLDQVASGSRAILTELNNTVEGNF